MGIDTILNRSNSRKLDIVYRTLAPNPDFYVRTDLRGNISYSNRNLRSQFPDLLVEGIEHPLLCDWDKIVDCLLSSASHQCAREISFNGGIFNEIFFYDSDLEFISIIIQDITDIKRTEEKLAHQLKESQTLLNTSQLLTINLKLPKTLESIISSATSLIKSADRAEIHLLNSTKDILEPFIATPASGLEDNGQIILSPIEGVAGLVVSTGDLQNIADTSSDGRYLPSIERYHHIKSLLIAPIKIEGEIIGTLGVHSKLANAFNQNDERSVRALGIQVAVAIRTAQLLETSKLKLKEVNSLFYISKTISESLNIESMLKHVVDLLQEIFGYYHAQVYLIEDASKELIFEYGTGLAGLKLKRNRHRIKIGDGIVGSVAVSGYPFVTNDVNKVPFFNPNSTLPNTKSEMAVPLRTNNRLIGVLDIQLDPPHTFTDDDLRLMTTVAELLAGGIEKATLYSVLQSALRQEQAMRAQLVQSEKLAALGRIVASVTHELNNPLQAIQNALYLVQLEESPNSQVCKDLQVAIEETKRMADLIKRLRHTYRPVDSNKYELGDINSIIKEVRKLISTHLRHNNIAFEVTEGLGIPPCPMIRDQIKQVLLNISLNAVETMPDGGILSVSVRHERDKNCVSISISDTGQGIPSNIRPYIFDPFVTTKDGGTGLGLAISNDIVKRHNGKIEVISQEGKGTTFIVYLPLVHEEVIQNTS